MGRWVHIGRGNAATVTEASVQLLLQLLYLFLKCKDQFTVVYLDYTTKPLRFFSLAVYLRTRFEPEHCGSRGNFGGTLRR